MKTVNSLSGGKTSSYIAIHYPADYNVFSLVRTNDINCKYPDKKVRQIVSDLLQVDFVGTLEQDSIIPVMLKLSERVDIDWITGETFEDIVKKFRGKDGNYYLPNIMTRYCTTHLKLMPIFNYWRDNINEVVDMRIGFRKGEERRSNKMISKLIDGVDEMKAVIGKRKTLNKWGMIKWRVPSFPLIKDGITSIDINNYWNKNNFLGFERGYYNNCVGCFHRSPLFLNKMSQEHKNKMQFFANLEDQNSPNTFKSDVKYKDIIKWHPQTELSFDDFNECDSGFCGL
jgi:hypothetical protein